MIGRTRIPFVHTVHCSKIDEQLQSALGSIFGKEFFFTLFPSGRSALYFGLRHLPVTYVVLPAFTCKAVLEAVYFAEKKPVFVDVNKETFCMEGKNLKAISLDGRYAVLCTHQYGFPAPLEEVAALCKATGAVLIEDCAASFGTTYRGLPTGTTGYFSIFSGDVFKMIPVTSGIGMLLTKDRGLVESIRSDGSYGSQKRSGFDRIKCTVKKKLLQAINRPFGYGLFYNLRFRFHAKKTNDTPELMQVIPQGYFHRVDQSSTEEFLTQLSRLPEYLEKRRAITSYYFSNLIHLKHIRIPELFSDRNDTLGLIRFPIIVTGIEKMEFYRRCISRGIDLGFVFSFPLTGSESICPQTTELCATVLNLPAYPDLTCHEMHAVVAAVRHIDSEI